MKLPKRVTICEVGTRDGFQIEPEFIPTDQKIEVVNRLAAAGMPRIEVTSFVSPKAIPQLRDAEEVMAAHHAAARHAPTRRWCPTTRARCARWTRGVDEIHTVVSASESHNLANVNMTIAESLAKLGAVAEVARRASVPVVLRHLLLLRLPVRGRRAGRPARVRGRARWWTWAPAASASPTPPAWPTPRRSAACSSTWCRASRASSGRSTPTTRGRWRSRTSWPRWSTGVTHFDASIGGLGGCPFAPGASGNVCTEDLVHCLHAMGVETGVDLDALIDDVAARAGDRRSRAARPDRQGGQVGPALSRCPTASQAAR